MFPAMSDSFTQCLRAQAGSTLLLLTVAVDDGIMPQTLEHLAILDLLDVKRGAVVLTKADLASPSPSSTSPYRQKP